MGGCEGARKKEPKNGARSSADSSFLWSFLLGPEWEGGSFTKPGHSVWKCDSPTSQGVLCIRASLKGKQGAHALAGTYCTRTVLADSSERTTCAAFYMPLISVPRRNASGYSGTLL